MLLTIGMIVKNEEKYLEQCLSGLKPILENIDSELIIADTGSTDRTVEIAKKFTDNVFYFEWINDFAAARNSTLEKAKGEWYMFVDGDEVFQNCDEIIKFFNTGEYKKYNSASFNIRNFLTPELDTFADFNGPRLTKILPHTKFVGEIHEAFTTYGAPFKRMKDTAFHYGYVYDAENNYDEKFKRNSELLLKKYEELKGTDDIDLRLYSQLYDCFINPKPELAEKFMEEGIELCKKKKNMVLITLYSSRIFTAYCNCQFEQLLEYAEEYFNIDKSIRPGELSSDAEILGLMGFALYNLNRYNEAIDVFIKFFDIFKRIQSGKLVTYDSFLGTTQLATDKNFIQILNAFCRCCALADKYNTAAGYLETLPIAKYSVVDDYIDLLVVFEMDLLEHFDYENANKYYRQFDAKGKMRFKERLKNRIYISDKKQEVINALSAVSKDDEMLKEMIGLYKSYFLDGSVSKEQIYSFGKKYGMNNNPDLLMMAVDKKYDISPLFKTDDFDMKLCVYKCYMRIYGFARLIDEYPAESIESTDDIPNMLKFLEYCMKTVPIYRSPKQGVFTKYSVENMFGLYAKLGRRYAGEKSASELPAEVNAACIAGDIIDARSEKRYKDCFAAMKKAIQAYDGIAAVIEEYQKIVLNEYQESTNSMSEMDRLALQIKRNIRNFIASGNYAAARKTLSEYSVINPNDAEIAELNELIKE